jgi:hypothetical protein
VKPSPGAPAVGVPKLYTRYGVLAATCVAENPAIFASVVVDPQVPVDAMSLTRFDAARLSPDNCKEHKRVSVQAVAPTSAPRIWKMPTSKLKLEL